MLHPLNNPAKDRPIYRAMPSLQPDIQRKDPVNMRPIFNHKGKPCSNITSKIEEG